MLLVGSEGSPRVGVPSRRLGASGRFGGDWESSWSYVWGDGVSERAYRAPGLGVQGGLRGAFRDDLGARVRVALGYVEKGFSSRANGRVPSSKIKGAANLTDGLTAGLTGRLTEVLTVGLTE